MTFSPGSRQKSIEASLLPSSCIPLIPSKYGSHKPKTWLLFGGAGAICREICKTCLGRGDSVMVADLIIEASESACSEQFKRQFEQIECDVRNEQSVKGAVEACVAKFGPIDIVVNGFGLGVIAACEDQDDFDIRSQIETNVIGVFNVLRGVLPQLRSQAIRDRVKDRQQKANETGDLDESEDEEMPVYGGRIFQLYSTLAVAGMPGFGPYCGAQWAMEGLCESLYYEIKNTGIRLIAAEFGYCRTDNDNRPKGPPKPPHFITKPLSSYYAGTPGEYGMLYVKNSATMWSLDIVKLANVIWEVGHCESPPLRLLLGSQAVENVQNKMRSVIEEIEDWKFMFDEP